MNEEIGSLSLKEVILGYKRLVYFAVLMCQLEVFVSRLEVFPPKTKKGTEIKAFKISKENGSIYA